MKPTVLLVLLSAVAAAQTEPTTTFVERGQDYAIYGRIHTFTDAGGRILHQTNQFTLLENALHESMMASGRRARM